MSDYFGLSDEQFGRFALQRPTDTRGVRGATTNG